MKLFFVYAGKRGSNLECAIALHTLAKQMGYDSKLILSKDNERAELVESLYPGNDVAFYNFFSLTEVIALKKELETGISFFTMFSPKIILPFLLLKSKKILYYHATYDHSFSKSSMKDSVIEFLHDILIKNSTMTVATQWPLAWQIRNRLGVEAEAMQHPSYASINPKMFEDKKDHEMNILTTERYILSFGGLDRYSKGTELLLHVVDHTNIRLILAGKANKDYTTSNVLHINRWVTDSELFHLIKNSEAVVLPYLVPSQFSGCLALAYHFGIPVVAPSSSAFNGIVTEGCGWKFPSGDPEGLRFALGMAMGIHIGMEIPIHEREIKIDQKCKEDLKKILDKVK